eukprot:TRINITY_DN36900_c0_g1_i2.p1 TRINITY_DN36900_c0_g1~~TRINITY_DN36900_c0_g1_i2.p1  ORF type:complete len:124 (-),score=45.45 TRINITY_DN36900_c0_g1_i2:94-465(-)
MVECGWVWEQGGSSRSGTAADGCHLVVVVDPRHDVAADADGGEFADTCGVVPIVVVVVTAWSGGIADGDGEGTPHHWIVDDVVVVLSLIHISEPTRLLSISYAVFCLKKKKKKNNKYKNQKTE